VRITALALLLTAGCMTPTHTIASPSLQVGGHTKAAKSPAKGLAEASFAGGCFWCMEKPFEHIEGVKTVESGYIGGLIKGPSYAQVSGHATQHLEAIRVVYDPEVITYAQLLTHFWHNIDPTDDAGQFCDKGHQYTTAIFTSNTAEQQAAEASKTAAVAELGQPIKTPIREGTTFWLAEEYHQDFYKKNAAHYQRYRLGCGRDRRLAELWGDAARH
jgi:peptide-methionine (S)-S-oxide reductase